MDKNLTKEQIKNWRDFLFNRVGIMALSATDEEIQIMKNNYQKVINNLVSRNDFDENPVNMESLPKLFNRITAMEMALKKAGITNG